MTNPQEQCPDTARCAYCEQYLPRRMKDDSWAFQGFCDAECALRYYIDAWDGGAESKMLHRAVSELVKRRAVPA